MSKDKRARYLRRQRERSARQQPTSSLPEWTEPGHAGEAVCEPCGLSFEVEMPVLGMTLELDLLDEHGAKRHESYPVAEHSDWFTTCPRCGSTATVINSQSAVDAEGVSWFYFASSEAQKTEIRELLGLLRDEDSSIEQVISEMEGHGPMLAALAAWLREQSGRVPAIVLEVVLGVLLTQLMFGNGLTAEDVERIMDEHEREHRQDQGAPRDNPRNQPREQGRPPHSDVEAEGHRRTLGKDDERGSREDS